MKKIDLFEPITENDEQKTRKKLKSKYQCCGNAYTTANPFTYGADRKIATVSVINMGCRYPNSALFLIFKFFGKVQEKFIAHSHERCGTYPKHEVDKVGFERGKIIIVYRENSSNTETIKEIPIDININNEEKDC